MFLPICGRQVMVCNLEGPFLRRGRRTPRAAVQSSEPFERPPVPCVCPGIPGGSEDFDWASLAKDSFMWACARRRVAPHGPHIRLLSEQGGYYMRFI